MYHKDSGAFVRTNLRLPLSDAACVCVCVYPRSHVHNWVFLAFSPVVHDRNQFYFLLMCYRVCFLAWLDWYSFISLSLSAELPFLYVSEKAFAFQWRASNSFTPLVQLVLLARKQSKYNCSLSSPPRHWFIHSPLQLGATNLRGSQLIHRTKI